jgi:hypothetical protein
MFLYCCWNVDLLLEPVGTIISTFYTPLELKICSNMVLECPVKTSAGHYQIVEL